MSLVLSTAAVLLALSIIACAYRLVRGPTLPDRIVALDLLGFQVVAIVGLAAITSGRAALLGVALVAAVILFLGTSAFALFLERRCQR